MPHRRDRGARTGCVTAIDDPEPLARVCESSDDIDTLPMEGKAKYRDCNAAIGALAAVPCRSTALLAATTPNPIVTRNPPRDEPKA